MKTISLSELRERLPDHQSGESAESFIITDRGAPVYALIPYGIFAQMHKAARLAVPVDQLPDEDIKAMLSAQIAPEDISGDG